ncbi:MAG TPA: Crp/Fnr family transcriptional regulator [Gemmatimonadaceae bacterium]|nr:Crp/Fnr family transcriptional regulator [Gemmatimonadaceae bacterium]
MATPGSTAADLDGRPRNLILASLPADEYAAIAPRLERVSLPARHVVCDVNRPIDYVYFPETCVASVLSIMADRSGVETATVGYEGMTGIALFLGGERSVEHTFMQVPGDAYRLRAEDFLAAVGGGIGGRTALATILGRYMQALFTLAAQTSGCNRVHTMRERCARWLLQTHDRAGADEFALTQHFLAQMLGVRRATVTEAAGALQEAGLIEYRYGKITIRDRAGLERVVCECYHIIRNETVRLLLGREATSDPLDGIQVSENERTTARDPLPVEEREAEPGHSSAAGRAP